MKERKKKKIEWIIGGFFIILFCLLIFYVIPSLDSFNEETDVCLEYEYEKDLKEQVKENPIYREDGIEKKEGKFGFMMKLYMRGVWGEPKCIDWRDKTICELDPNSEECICDEYEYELFCEERAKIIYENYNETIPQCKEGYKEWCYQRNHLVCECTKSHLPNECEKNNPEYLFDYNKYYYNNGSIYDECELSECEDESEWRGTGTTRVLKYCMYVTDTPTLFLSTDKNCEDYKVFEKFCRKKNKCELNDENFIWDCPPIYTETIEDNEWRMVDSKDLGEPCVIESTNTSLIINCTNEEGITISDVWTVTPPLWKINTGYIKNEINEVTYEDCTCREKTNLEKLKDKLKEFDCEKILLDLNEDCLFNCKHNYYSEQDETIKDYYIFKGCKI